MTINLIKNQKQNSMVEKVTVFEDGMVFTLTSGEEVRVAPC